MLLPQATHLALGTGHVPFYDDPAAVVETVRIGTRDGAAVAHHR